MKQDNTLCANANSKILSVDTFMGCSTKSADGFGYIYAKKEAFSALLVLSYRRCESRFTVFIDESNSVHGEGIY